MSAQAEALKLALEGAANYIDALGGDSRKYRQALAEQPAVSAGPITPAMMQGPTPEQKSQMVAAMSKLAEQPAQQQEPVAFIDMREWPPIRWRDGMVRKDVARFDGQGLFFSPPPQRKPLTDGQVIDMANKALPGWTRKDNDLAYLQVARAIEAAHDITGEQR